MLIPTALSFWMRSRLESPCSRKRCTNSCTTRYLRGEFQLLYPLQVLHTSHIAPLPAAFLVQLTRTTKGQESWRRRSFFVVCVVGRSGRPRKTMACPTALALA